MIRVVLFLMVLAGPGAADEVQEFSDALGQVAAKAMVADAYVVRCNIADPAGAEARRDLRAVWRHRNRIAEYDAVMAATSALDAGVAAQHAGFMETVAAAVAEDVAADPGVCDRLGEVFAQEDYAVGPVVRRLVRVAPRFGIEIGQPEPEAETGPVPVLPLGTFSALARGVMAQVGSAAGALGDRTLREARAEHLEAVLARENPVLVLQGRVTGADRMREWRGEMQSVFALRCRSFMDEGHARGMEAALGRDMVVVGKPSSVVEHANGEALLQLRDCGLMAPEETGQPLAAAVPDAEGFVLRPPEDAEVFAEGALPMGEVVRVIYTADFTNRMDGFGNGYTDRSEAVHVLLRDGTAFLHDRVFPFGDLDIVVSRAREPGKWFRWREGPGDVRLVGADGEERVLEGGREVRPFAPGERLAGEFYFLSIGMMGARSDRSFDFLPDGRVRHFRGGFVAGNVGTSFLMVTPAPDAPTVSDYRLEGYVLEVGEARYFIGRPEGESGVLIGGEVYWAPE